MSASGDPALAELLSLLREWDGSEADLSCLVADAQGRRNGMDARVRPMWPGARAIGRAVTADAGSDDLLPVLTAIDLAGAGDVVVISSNDPFAVALWGENTTLSAMNRGATGAVLWAPCRDVGAHARAAFPLFATGCSPLAGSVGTGSAVQVPVRVGGVEVRPGDLIVADANGVAVVPSGDAGRVLHALPALRRRDEAIKERLRTGGTLGQVRGDFGGYAGR